MGTLKLVVRDKKILWEPTVRDEQLTQCIEIWKTDHLTANNNCFFDGWRLNFKPFDGWRSTPLRRSKKQRQLVCLTFIKNVLLLSFLNFRKVALGHCALIKYSTLPTAPKLITDVTSPSIFLIPKCLSERESETWSLFTMRKFSSYRRIASMRICQLDQERALTSLITGGRRIWFEHFRPCSEYFDAKVLH